MICYKIVDNLGAMMQTTETELAMPPVPEDEPGKDHQTLLEHLRRIIISQDLPPGARLREQSLAEQFGVSRARIREALAALEQTGLIEREPNRGAVVRRPSAAELLQIFDVREALEGLCARLATEKVPPASWQDLVDLFGEPTERMVVEGDVAGYLRSHDQLRRRMLDAAGNPVLAASLQPLTDRTGPVMRRLVLVTDRIQVALLEHRAILAAMRRGDAEEAERLKRTQIRSAREAVERYHAYLL
jgi:DNA-binding GntR family transcriptional regulator